MKRALLTTWLIVLAVVLCQADVIDSLKEGCLLYIDEKDNAPYPIPSVKTDLATMITDGFVHGRLTQTFINPLNEFLEAIYIFPMPENGAVHGMCALTSKDILWGEIKKKQEAIAIYDSAKAAGLVAALLLQNRPNIFKQQVANIPPHDTVQVIITYSALLKYTMGQYEMSFPTTVGPRYNPTDAVSKRTIQYAPPDTRHGASLSISILLMTGYLPDNIHSVSHEITVSQAVDCLPQMVSLGMVVPEHRDQVENAKWITLTNKDELPNKDFVLRFGHKNKHINYSFSAYKGRTQSDTGYFALSMFPSLIDTTTDPLGASQPLDLLLVLDRSGSQSGWPLQKAKEISYEFLKRIGSDDKLNVLQFNTSVATLFPQSEQATSENIQKARDYVQSIGAGGGTELQKAVQYFLNSPPSPGYQKVAAFITDGYIGHDQDVLRMIKESTQGYVFFAFGTGNSVNRYLIEEMGRISGGVGYVVTLSETATAAVDYAWAQLRLPQLDNVQIDFGTINTFACSQSSGSKLYTGQPLVVSGQYAGSGSSTIQVTATRNGQPYSYSQSVEFPQEAHTNRVLPKVWAREVIRDLELDPKQQDRITELGLAYSIMTAYTAFVAVSQEVVNLERTYTSEEIATLWPDGVAPFVAGQPFVFGEDPENPLGLPTAVDDAQLPSPATSIPCIKLAVQHHRIAGLVSISLMLPQHTTDQVKIEIYDIYGRLVRVLYNRPCSNQMIRANWNGTDSKSRLVPSGLYMIRVTVGNRVFHKAITFTR